MTPTDPPGDRPAFTCRTIAVYCLAIVSVATAVIHFAVAGEHFQEYWAFGVFMLGAAWFQLLWAVAVVARPSPTLLRWGVVLDAGVVAVYVLTRTVGDMVGPTPDEVEPVGFGDAFCTVLEAVVVVGGLWLLLTRWDRRASRRGLVTASAVTGVLTAILLSFSLVDGGSEMVMAAGAASSPTTMPGIRLATTSPAGDITMPDADMPMVPGMRMAGGAACTARPSKGQETAAVDLVDRTWAASEKYQSLAAATAAGYRPLTPTGRPVVHYVDVDAYRDTALGGPVLDTSRPQALVYANTPNGAVLAAAMFITRPHGPTPRPGGCLTQWHAHTNLCLDGGLGELGEVGAAHPACPAGSAKTPPVMHVWFVPIPGGPTAVDPPDRQVVRAAEQVSAPANGRA